MMRTGEWGVGSGEVWGVKNFGFWICDFRLQSNPKFKI
ncbi:hypothetical protein N9414_20155 [Nodularia spumigena CCY9414]|nr:hypothetical protein N9414_20155 [Nodularia spumigena CCY9414]